MESSEAFEQLEGRNCVLEALKGKRTVKRVYISEDSSPSPALDEIGKLARSRGVPVSEISRQEIIRMAKSENPQGVIARVSEYRYATPEELFATFSRIGSPLVMALDEVMDPQNLGSLLRVADACGSNGVIVGKRRSSPVTPAVCRASAGASEHVLVVRVANVLGLVLRLKKEGLWIIGADARGKIPYYEIDFTLPTCIVLGGEGKGLSRLIGERCDFITSIPMLGEVGSLNVATAAAVIMFEAVRQRALE